MQINPSIGLEQCSVQCILFPAGKLFHSAAALQFGRISSHRSHFLINDAPFVNITCVHNYGTVSNSIK